MMRQTHKQTLTIALLLQVFFAFAGIPVEARAGGLGMATVTNPITGVAIDGMDAVSYFTDPQPKEGSADFEFDWNGVPWYFANAANRDAFARSPGVYSPQFGGHGAMSLARGFLSDGNPRIYALVAQRLYLFYSAANRDAFLSDPGTAINAAMAQWSVSAGQMANADVAPSTPASSGTPPVAPSGTPPVAASGATVPVAASPASAAAVAPAKAPAAAP